MIVTEIEVSWGTPISLELANNRGEIELCSIIRVVEVKLINTKYKDVYLRVVRKNFCCWLKNLQLKTIKS